MNIQKSVVFLYASNKRCENETKITPFTIALKKIIYYLGRNLILPKKYKAYTLKTTNIV